MTQATYNKYIIKIQLAHEIHSTEPDINFFATKSELITQWINNLTKSDGAMLCDSSKKTYIKAIISLLKSHGISHDFYSNYKFYEQTTNISTKTYEPNIDTLLKTCDNKKIKPIIRILSCLALYSINITLSDVLCLSLIHI